jgi:hypothetical protein
MIYRFVLDENLRGPLWKSIQNHNALGVDLLDAVRVGDSTDLPLGTTDPDLLRWAEANDRFLVSKDRRTMPAHFADHLAGGRHVPGVLICRDTSTLTDLVEFLVLIAHASLPDEWLDRLDYFPP